MPDQSSAATEHAILQEITAPLETLPDDPVAMVVNADFPSALRGYDRLAVDAYVQQTSQLVAELHATRSPEAAVRKALERVGEQISGILQRAHETAEQITAQSRAEAEDRLEEVRAEAADIIAAAQQRVKDLDADTDRIWIERGRIVDDARDLAAQLLAVTENASDRFPEVEPDPQPVDRAEEPEAQDDELEPPLRTGPTSYDEEPDATVRFEPADDDAEATRRLTPVSRRRQRSASARAPRTTGDAPPASAEARRRRRSGARGRSSRPPPRPPLTGATPASPFVIGVRSARDRSHASRTRARDRLLAGRRRADRSRAQLLPGHVAGRPRGRAGHGRSCSPTSISTTPAPPGRSSSAGPRSRSTSTSAAPAT